MTNNNIHPPSGFFALIYTVFIHYRPQLFNILFSGSIAATVNILSYLILSRFIADISESYQSGNGFLVFLCFMLMISSSLFFLIHSFFLKSLKSVMVSDILGSLWSRFIHAPTIVCPHSQSGDICRQIFDYEAAVSAVPAVSIRILSGLISSVFLVCYMAYLAATPALIFCSICLLISALRISLLPTALRHTTQWLQSQRKLSALINEALQSIQKIRSTHTEHIIFKRWMTGLFQLKKDAGHTVRTEMFGVAIDKLIPVILLLSLQYMLYCHSTHLASGTFLAFILLGGQFSVLITKIFSDISSLIPLLPALSSIKPFLHPSSHPEPAVRPHYSVKGAVTLDQICFKSPDGKMLLHNIHLSVPAGAFAAITGPSGSGKSTLFRLILGLDQPSSGRILIDGRNIMHMDIKQRRQSFGVILQNQALLAGTIYENITANTPLTTREIWRLADIVGLRQDIESMPMGIHTHLSGQSGESISGGQRQKILLARALSTKPRILLLDEATSALDNHSQAHVCNSLNALNITRIVTAHRLSTIKGADLVYELNNRQGVTKKA